MLNFNKEMLSSSKKEELLKKEESYVQKDTPSWKVLIYDQFGRDIISPLLKVNDLRESEVTLHK
jgi:hypothetical protein